MACSLITSRVKPGKSIITADPQYKYGKIHICMICRNWKAINIVRSIDNTGFSGGFCCFFLGGGGIESDWVGGPVVRTEPGFFFFGGGGVVSFWGDTCSIYCNNSIYYNRVTDIQSFHLKYIIHVIYFDRYLLL